MEMREYTLIILKEMQDNLTNAHPKSRMQIFASEILLSLWKIQIIENRRLQDIAQFCCIETQWTPNFKHSHASKSDETRWL